MATATIKSDSNNDFFIDAAHNLVLLTGIDACSQDVRSKTLMRTGEDIFNVKDGVGYFQFIFTPQQSFDEARRSLSTAILSVPDVTGIESLSIEIDGEVFNFEARVATIYGPLTVRNP